MASRPCSISKTCGGAAVREGRLCLTELTSYDRAPRPKVARWDDTEPLCRCPPRLQRLVPFSPSRRGDRAGDARRRSRRSSCSPSASREVVLSCRRARCPAALVWRGARCSFPLLLVPAPPRPRRHVVEAAGAAAGAAGGGGGACTARSGGPRARTLTGGCSLHQVTPRGPEAGRAHPQRRLLARPIPLTELGWRRVPCGVQPAPVL